MILPVCGVIFDPGAKDFLFCYSCIFVYWGEVVLDGNFVEKSRNFVTV
jgi:hypothetical protein